MRKKIVVSYLFLTMSIASANVFANARSESSDNQLFQVATLYTLEIGIFDGAFPYQKLMQKGNLGIGTFTGIDGEMVAVDGKYYQGTPDCRLRPVDPQLMAPFAEVVQFHPTINTNVSNTPSYQDLQQKISALFPNMNMPYAIRIDGLFSRVKVRNLTKQTPPYPNLVTASKQQGELELKNVHGTAVGFWFPHYWEGIGMPGFHFHFATADHQFGGHVLDLNLAEGKVQLQGIQNVNVFLPNIPAFANAKIPDATQIEQDLQSVEGTTPSTSSMTH